MNNFNNIQQLWQQSLVKPDLNAEEIIQLIKKQRRNMLRKMITSTAILVFTFVGIALLAMYYRFAEISTRAGIALILISVLAAVILNSRLIVQLSSVRTDDDDNKTMLANMLLYQQRQQFLQTTFISAYFITLTIGIILYMYEITRRDHLFMAIAYTITLGWIAYAWWYIRPRTIRKQTAGITTMINHLKSLEAELSEDAGNQQQNCR